MSTDTRTETVGLYGSDAPGDDQRRAVREGRVPTAVYGLGKMGLPLAAAFAETTGAVHGVDVDPDRVATLRDGDNPFEHEPGLSELVAEVVADVEASAVEGEPHVAATLTLDNGVLATLTASRVTHQKVRQLAVTGRECQVTVDYLTQSVDIHRQSLPEYVERDGDVRYRSESVVERPQVNSGEPLRRELESFVDAFRNDRTPAVTGEDGLRALELTRRIEAAVDQRPAAGRPG